MVSLTVKTDGMSGLNLLTFIKLLMLIYLFITENMEKILTSNTEKLLKTRSDIYKKHAERLSKPNLSVLAVLPEVRGSSIDKNSQVLEILGEKSLIEWTIDAALSSEFVSEIIVTTPDEDIIKFLSPLYGRK